MRFDCLFLYNVCVWFSGFLWLELTRLNLVTSVLPNLIARCLATFCRLRRFSSVEFLNGMWVSDVLINNWLICLTIGLHCKFRYWHKMSFVFCLPACLSIVCDASVLWQKGWRQDHTVFTEMQPYALTLCLPGLITTFERGPYDCGSNSVCGFWLRDAISRR